MLTCHGICNQESFHRIKNSLYVLKLFHHAVIQVETAGCIGYKHVELVLLGIIKCILDYRNRVL